MIRNRSYQRKQAPLQNFLGGHSKTKNDEDINNDLNNVNIASFKNSNTKLSERSSTEKVSDRSSTEKVSERSSKETSFREELDGDSLDSKFEEQISSTASSI
ncbi:hypothetical protein C0J52_18745 [Blattella germanica]|nr:hypothetical protein C0J52_18745 [Blattella germanica]